MNAPQRNVITIGSLAAASFFLVMALPAIASESPTDTWSEYSLVQPEEVEVSSETVSSEMVDLVSSLEAAPCEDCVADLGSYSDYDGSEEYCNGSCDRGCSRRGCFTHSDRCFDRFISPMTNPTFFEDPRTLTETRLIFLNHKVPGAAGGGDVQLAALQIRAAINDRLSIVAAKDGYIWSSNPLIEDGWADVAVGLKYNLWRDVRAQKLLSAGVSYELPLGSSRARQGNGDGEFHLYLTGGTQLYRRGHWISAFGVRLATEPFQESQSIYWSNHFDYQLNRCWYVFSETNLYHWTKSGGQPGLNGVEGGDLFNFGSTGVAGNTIVTGAIGLKYKPNVCTEVGVAWETPLTDRQDVMENRLTFDLIRRF